MEQTLTETQKKILFWASFLSLAACGVGFAFRIAYMVQGYGKEFELTNLEVGNIAGSCFWPIAITMILFSLVVDKTGYKMPMLIAAFLQIISGVGTAMANSYEMLLLFAICAGLGHGIIEAVINPACAAVYPKAKTKMLTILHAAWPAGLVGGTLLVIGTDAAFDGLDWRIHALWIVIPAVIYGLLFIPAKFPVDERVQAGIPFMDMLKEVGFMGMALASFMLIYQIGGVLSGIFGLFPLPSPSTWFLGTLAAGIVIGGIFGIYVKSVGKPLFFLLCLLMIPVATAELSTDNWIKPLMTPVLGEGKAAWAIVFSAGIMFLLRTFAGGVLRFFSPPMLMATSGVLSAAGLLWLGAGAAQWAIFVAFFIYAVGQTYYWPCILGFVSEQYPKGGALTLNLVSALALLSLGMVGTPILGLASDKSTYNQAQEEMPKVVEVVEDQSPFLWTMNDVAPAANLPRYGATQIKGQGETIITGLSPLFADDEKLTKSVAGVKADLDKAADKEEIAARWVQLAINRIDIEAIKIYDLLKGAAEGLKDEDAKKKALEELQAALPESSQEGIANYNDVAAKHGEMQVKAGRDVLVFAAIFPGILVVCFVAIAIYFRSIGGYKPIELLKDGQDVA